MLAVTDVRRNGENEIQRPRECCSRGLCIFRLRLGHLLEATVCKAGRVRLVDRNRRSDDFSDEVVPIPSDPDVSSLIDGSGATRMQEC